MKTTGIVRKVDELGRVVIPMELRRNLDIDIKDPMEIFTDGDKIILRKYVPGCSHCGFIGIATTLGNISLCAECRDKLALGSH
jgi:transcriptional pleiotropic regulator of transition state genes